MMHKIILLLATSFATIITLQAQNTQLLHPDEVFIIQESQLQQETTNINRTIAGQWKYAGPSVEVRGRNIIAGAGKAIAKSKLKKKLNKAYKKVGLGKMNTQFQLNDDGSCAIILLGHHINGSYNYNPDDEKITFRWLGLPISARLKADGKKKLHLTFESDKLLWLLRIAGRLTSSDALQAIELLTNNYQDVMLGFELKK